jgi:predicted AAA+ superfamily ATPase
MPTLKPWREIAAPHEDVLKGTFQQAEFAADLARVHAGSATPEYQDPALFYKRTFITEGMRLLLDSVIKRLVGHGGDPVIQLQTAFGGGKTHTLLAVYHLAAGKVPTSNLQGIPPLLDAAKVTELPKAKLVVLDGNQLAPNIPRKHGKIMVRTMWGELAWQLGGDSAYEQIRAADESGTSPGKQEFTRLLTDHAPCVILMDEMVAYFRQFEEGKSFTGGTYDSNLSFIQALTEAMKAVPTAVLLASLPESDKEAGSQRGINALRTLEHFFARVQALWKPVGTEEAFEIVRRRLFDNLRDRKSAEAVCRAFADYYADNSDFFPHDTQAGRYYDRLVQAYPIHPEVFDRLYEDWSTLENFQRTRGVLKLMAKVIYRLWKDGNNDLMILPGSLPLYDADTRNEAVYYLPAGWDPVVERDIDGERAETTDIENHDTRLGSIQACRRTARTIFLGSAPSTANQMARGLERERIILGAAAPDQQPGLFDDAIRRLSDRLHYLNTSNKRYWFDTRPNLRREMEERKRRYQDKEEVFPAIRERLQKIVSGGGFESVHVFTMSADISDDYSLRLVILPPDASYSKSIPKPAVDAATEILQNRGAQPRQKQNRLIFLVADLDSITRMKDQVRSVLAWQSIVADIKDLKLNLDQIQSRQAEKNLEDANAALQRTIRETYKWLLAPMQEAKPGKGLSEVVWEPYAMNPSAQSITSEIERVLRENEVLITDWAPIHLSKMLKDWFWKESAQEVSALEAWQKTCQYLYLPRLKNESVFRNAIIAGSSSQDFFGFAYEKEGGEYTGFTLGKAVPLAFDATLLLIEPSAAKAYAKRVDLASKAEVPTAGTKPTGEAPSSQAVGEGTAPGLPTATAPGKIVNRKFYGAVELDPFQAKRQFADIADEVLMLFTAKPNVSVKIHVEIQAESSSGFDEGLQRSAKENCNVLKFKASEFEEG